MTDAMTEAGEMTTGDGRPWCVGEKVAVFGYGHTATLYDGELAEVLSYPATDNVLVKLDGTSANVKFHIRQVKSVRKVVREWYINTLTGSIVGPEDSEDKFVLRVAEVNPGPTEEYEVVE